LAFLASLFQETISILWATVGFMNDMQASFYFVLSYAQQLPHYFGIFMNTVAMTIDDLRMCDWIRRTFKCFYD